MGYPSYDLTFESHLERQAAWSEKTFGPGPRTKGVCDHIRKELGEVERSGGSIDEWIDVLILALDGCWRTGTPPHEIVAKLKSKQDKNEAREWPDWRERSEDEAIEHQRSPAERRERIMEIVRDLAAAGVPVAALEPIQEHAKGLDGTQ